MVEDLAQGARQGFGVVDGDEPTPHPVIGDGLFRCPGSVVPTTGVPNAIASCKVIGVDSRRLTDGHATTSAEA